MPNEPSVCACGNFASALCVKCREPLCNKCKKDRRPWNEQWDDDLNIVPSIGVLCLRCRREHSVEHTEINASHVRASERGRECRECYSKKVRGRCFVCRAGYCAKHRIECKRCHRQVCSRHGERERMLCENCVNAETRAVATANAFSESANRKAMIAIHLSHPWAFFCCAPIALAGLVVGILAIVDFSRGKDQHGIGLAIQAVVISALSLMIFLLLLVRVI